MGLLQRGARQHRVVARTGRQCPVCGQRDEMALHESWQSSGLLRKRTDVRYGWHCEACDCYVPVSDREARAVAGIPRPRRAHAS